MTRKGRTRVTVVLDKTDRNVRRSSKEVGGRGEDDEKRRERDRQW